MRALGETTTRRKQAQAGRPHSPRASETIGANTTAVLLLKMQGGPGGADRSQVNGTLGLDRMKQANGGGKLHVWEFKPPQPLTVEVVQEKTGGKKKKKTRFQQPGGSRVRARGIEEECLLLHRKKKRSKGAS